MLRIDTRVQRICHCYYHALGDKSEGGTGDTQINQGDNKSVCAQNRGWMVANYSFCSAVGKK